MKEGIIMLTVRLTGSYIAILSIISLSASSLFAASASTPKWEQLVAAGRKEGRVVLIAPPFQTCAKPIPKNSPRIRE